MTDFQGALAGWQNLTLSRGKMPLRAAFWRTSKPQGQILLLGGMRDFAEKNTLEAQTFASWGMETVALDWHNQGRSGRLSGVNPRYSHTRSFADYGRDLQTLWPHIKPDLAVAHSMGAHNALRFWAENAITTPLVITAPLMGVRLGMSEGVARGLTTLAKGLGMGPKLAPGQTPYVRPPFEGNIYSRDPARFNEMFDWMEHDETLKKDGATYGWVNAFLGSAAKLRSPRLLKQIKAPVLAFLTPNDPLVVGVAQEVLAQHIPNITVERLTDCRHEPLREEARVRTPLMEKIRAFSQAHSQKPAP